MFFYLVVLFMKRLFVLCLIFMCLLLWIVDFDWSCNCVELSRWVKVFCIFIRIFWEVWGFVNDFELFLEFVLLIFVEVFDLVLIGIYWWVYVLIGGSLYFLFVFYFLGCWFIIGWFYLFILLSFVKYIILSICKYKIVCDLSIIKLFL